MTSNRIECTARLTAVAGAVALLRLAGALKDKGAHYRRRLPAALWRLICAVSLVVSGFCPVLVPTPAFAAIAPDIRVASFSNNIEITSGDVTPQTADGTDFGSVGVGSSTANSFVVQNTAGNSVLTLGAVTITGSSDFAVTTQPSLVIPTTGTFDTGITTMVITFTPSSAGLKTATVTITSDDPDEGTYTFSIQGGSSGSSGSSVSSATSQMIADYLGARNAMILGHRPDIERRLDRLRAGIADDGATVSTSYGPSERLRSPIDVRMSGGILSYGASAGALRSFSDGELGHGVPVSGLGSWDLWSEGYFSLFNDGGSQSGKFGIVHVGADYRLTQNILLGVRGEIDWMDQRFASTSGNVSGTGWMIGPYGTFRLGPAIYLDVAALAGMSGNMIAPLGTYSDRFDTTRWMAHASLVGEFNVGALMVQPKLSAEYVSEHQHAYTDSLGASVPAQTVATGQIEFAPRFSVDRHYASGGVLSPWLEPGLVYTFGSAANFTQTSYANSALGLSGSVRAGLEWRRPGGARLDLSAQYGGIGSAHVSYGARVGFTMPLDAQRN